MSSNLEYLFKITSITDQKLYFTSSWQKRIIADITYLPDSGLSIVNGEFNDSAENVIILHGIFEDNGIKKEEDFSGAIVEVKYIESDNIFYLASLICTKYTIKDLEFEMICQTETIKYNQPIIQMFSRTCRANFGDNKCKVDTNKLAIECNVTEILDNKIKCNIDNITDGYFTDGKAITKDHNNQTTRIFKILGHNGQYIYLEPSFSLNTTQKKIILIPGCNKNYRTCCYSFNNAINFRGEPTIPEYKIIKN